MATNVNSRSQLSDLFKKNTIVVIDFHATWCGPCKVLEPIFEEYARRFRSPGKVAFTRCDVDAHKDIAQFYDIRSMPTILILKNEETIERIVGVQKSALESALQRITRNVPSMQGFANSGKGYKLGSGTTETTTKETSTSTTAAPVGRVFLRNGQLSNSVPINVQSKKYLNLLIDFFGLYFVSLFSIDAISSAANSSFTVRGGTTGGDSSLFPRGGGSGGHGGPPGPPGPPPGRRLGTIKDLEGTGDVRTRMRFGGCGGGGCT